MSPGGRETRMKQQRESYEAMQTVIKEFLDTCRKTDPWVSNIETLAGAARIMARTAPFPTESTALAEIASRFDTLAALQVKVQGILAGLPAHPHWPCDGCQRFTEIGCNRKAEGGFWG
jgi:hypothetical protein